MEVVVIGFVLILIFYKKIVSDSSNNSPSTGNENYGVNRNHRNSDSNSNSNSNNNSPAAINTSVCNTVNALMILISMIMVVLGVIIQL